MAAEKEGEEGALTASIYIDGEEEVTATGEWDPDEEKTSVTVMTQTPE